MNSWTSATALWVADYYLAATMLLLIAWTAVCLVRQPIHRVTVAWMTMAGLAVLIVACSLPAWPRVPVLSLLPAPPVPSASTVLTEDAPVASTPQSPAPMLETPHEEATRTHRGLPSLANVPVEHSGEMETQPTEPTVVEPNIVYPVEETSSRSFGHWPGCLGVLFLVGGALTGLWLLAGAAQMSLLCRAASRASEPLRAALSRIVGEGQRVPRLLLSPNLSSAVVLGTLRPTILLPSAVVDEAARNGASAALAHEWAHIKNGDLWLLASGRLMLLLLFAHPLFWLLRWRVRLDQEAVADAMAAKDIGREDYAKELVAWARISLGLPIRRLPAALAIQERPSRLEARIADLLDESVRITTDSSRGWSYASLAMAGLIALPLSTLTFQPDSSVIADSVPTSQATAGNAPVATAVPSATITAAEVTAETSNDEVAAEEPEEFLPEDAGSLAVLEQLGVTLYRDEGGNVTTVRLPKSVDEPEKLAHLKGLPKLNSVVLYGSDLVDRDLAFLANLPSVEGLSLNASQFTEEGVQTLQRLPNLHELSLVGEAIEDACLDLLTQLPRLEELGLSSTRVTEEALGILAELPNLNSLRLVNLRVKLAPYTPQFTDKSLAILARHTKLKSLSMWTGTRASDEGVKQLATMTSLESLCFRGSDISDAGLECIGKLKNLEELRIWPKTLSSGGRITDAGLEHLKGLSKLKTLNIKAGYFTDSGMQPLAAFTELESLSLSRTKITEEGLKHLAGLPKLEHLRLSGMEYTDAALKELSQFPCLKNLNVETAGVTDAGMATLGRMTSVQSLRLYDEKITDKGVLQLSGMTELESLSLRRVRITNAGLEHLHELPRLEALSIYDTFVTDEGLRHLQNVSTLKRLTLGGPGITGAGFAYIKQLPGLERLNVSRTLVNDESLKHFTEMKQLTNLSLAETRITDAGLHTLSECKSLQKLTLDNNAQLTGAGLIQLKGLESLTELVLSQTQLTDDGLSSLRKAIPRCRITWSPFRALGITRVAPAVASEKQPKQREIELDLANRNTPIRPEVPTKQESGGDRNGRIDRETAIKQIRRVGGSVTVDKGTPGEPVRSVRVTHGDGFDDRAMACLTAFPELEMLHLHDAKITDASMEHLKTLRSLKWLTLPGTQVTDAGLVALKDLPNLERLGLGLRGNITDDGLNSLKDFPKLKGLQLSTDFTDAGLEHLASLTNLESLAIFNCPGVTDDGIEALNGLTNLKMLVLVDIKVSDASMTHIAKFKELRWLSLQSESMTGAWLADTGVAVTDTGFAELAGLTKLEHLDLWNLGISDAGLDALQEMNRLESVTFARMKITDAGLKRLEGIETLERLSVLSCDVTSAGVEKLQAKMTGLRVHHR